MANEERPDSSKFRKMLSDSLNSGLGKNPEPKPEPKMEKIEKSDVKKEPVGNRGKNVVSRGTPEKSKSYFWAYALLVLLAGAGAYLLDILKPFLILMAIIIVLVVVVDIIKRTKFSYKEGDEVEGVTEETEDALKPEDRSPGQVLQHFAQYPIIAAGISFLIVFLAFLSSLGLIRSMIFAFSMALVVGVAVSFVVIKWIVIIPSDPPFIGAITVGGRVTKWVAPAGYFLTIPYLLDVIPIDTRRVDQDLVVQGIYTKDRGFVSVSGHASYQADPKRLPMLIQSGKIIIDKDGKLVIKGVASIFDNMYLQYQRAEINKLDIEPALGASEVLTQNISKHFTGEDHLDLDTMSRRGRSDVRGLGIIIFIVNVTSVLPHGATKKALELEVTEKFERKGEVYEVVTRVRQALADIFMTQGLDITEMTQAQIRTELANIRKDDPEKLDEKIKSLKTSYIEYEMARKSPGSIIPGMRERLIQKDGSNSIPWDVIGANFADMLKKPGQAEIVKKEKTEKFDNKKKGKGKGKKESEKSEEEDEDYE